MLLKVLVYGPFGYIKNPYNIFDGIIVVIRYQCGVLFTRVSLPWAVKLKHRIMDRMAFLATSALVLLCYFLYPTFLYSYENTLEQPTSSLSLVVHYVDSYP